MTICDLYNEDSTNILNLLIGKYEKKINLVIADPPYFLSNGSFSCKSGKSCSVDKGDWDKQDKKSINEIHEFNCNWLYQVKELLHSDGTIWVFGTHHNIFSIGMALQNLNFKILNHIIWEKPNPPPNLSCRFFNFSFENIIWAAKSKTSKYTFNYELMKKLNENKQDKAIWKISSHCSEQKTTHTTQKPTRIMNKLILSSSNEHDLILDPFMGSGTVGVSSVLLNRNYIGIEKDEHYFKSASERIFKTKEQKIC